jgi:predicted house-cleaning noncanonical NTP pyrophosphatase (MazG superfamily)
MVMISGDDLEAFGYWEMVDAYPPKEKTVLEMVKEFIINSGQKIDPGLYESLISEEYGEWFSAYDPEEMEDHPVEELKELADLVYVIYGYAISLGWNLDEAVRRVHENNMGRCIQPDGTIKRREDGKVIKNPEYPKVDLSDLV